MKKIRHYTRLIRLGQWYKNLIIFTPLLFASNVHSVQSLIVGFFGFSCISSITYIVNDWMDREKDRLHPVKKNRPLASGEITGKMAIVTSVILSIVVVLTVLKLGLFYGSIILTYFVITNLYSFGLKDIPVLDIVIIAGNFVLRMMAGIQGFPDIVTAPYFGLLLGVILIFLTHKRRSDIKLLGEKAVKHKPVLNFYTKKNNYLVRGVAYLTTLISFYLLWQNGVLIYKLLGVYFLLLATSFIFSDNPEYTSNPQHLFRSKIWIGVLIANIVMFAWLWIN